MYTKTLNSFSRLMIALARRKKTLVVVVIVFVIAAIVIINFAIQNERKGVGLASDSSVLQKKQLETDDFVLTSSSRRDDWMQIIDFDLSRDSASLFSQKTALYRLLVDADVESLMQYLELSNELTRDGWRRDVRLAIMQRMAVVDPSEAFNLLNQFSEEDRDVYIPVVIQEWAWSNLSEVIEHIRLFDDKLKLVAIESVISARDDLDIVERRNIARQLGHEWIALKELLQHRSMEEIFEDPEKEWHSFVLEYGQQSPRLSDSQVKLFRFIAQCWILQDGVDAVQRMTNSFPQRWSLHDLLSYVLDDLVQVNPKLAFRISVGVSELRLDQQQELAERVLSYWVDSDPKDALDATFNIEHRSLRRKLQQHIVKTWAQSNPFNLLLGHTSLPVSIHDLAKENVAIELAKEDPKRALETMNQITDLDVRTSVLEKIVGNWAQNDISSVIDWIESDQSVSYQRETLLKKAFRSLAAEDPHLALQTALNLPIEGNQGMEAIVIDWVGLRDLDSAVAMLPDIRVGQTRQSAYDSLIVQSILFGDYERANKLFLEMTSEKEVSRGNLGLFHLVLHTPRRLYTSLLQLPAGDSQIETARSLIRRYKGKGVFTDEQMVHLHEIVSQPREQQSQLSEENLQRAKEQLERLLKE